MRSRSHGLRVTPQVGDSVTGSAHSGGTFLRPITTAPAARTRRTTSASSRRRLAVRVRPVRGDVARHVRVVLDGDGHAQQRPVFAGANPARGRLVGLGRGALAVDGAKRVEPRVEALDAPEVELDELARRHLAGPHQLGLAGDRREGESSSSAGSLWRGSRGCAAACSDDGVRDDARPPWTRRNRHRAGAGRPAWAVHRRRAPRRRMAVRWCSATTSTGRSDGDRLGPAAARRGARPARRRGRRGQRRRPVRPAVGLGLAVADARLVVPRPARDRPPRPPPDPGRATQNLVSPPTAATRSGRERIVRLVIAAAYDAPRTVICRAARRPARGGAGPRVTGGRCPAPAPRRRSRSAAVAGLAGARLGGVDAGWVGARSFPPSACSRPSGSPSTPGCRGPGPGPTTRRAARRWPRPARARPRARRGAWASSSCSPAPATGPPWGCARSPASRRKRYRPEATAVIHLAACGTGPPAVLVQRRSPAAAVLHPRMRELATARGRTPYRGREGASGAWRARRRPAGRPSRSAASRTRAGRRTPAAPPTRPTAWTPPPCERALDVALALVYGRSTRTWRADAGLTQRSSDSVPNGLGGV